MGRRGFFSGRGGRVIWSCSLRKQGFEFGAPSGPGAGGQPCLQGALMAGRGGSAAWEPV